MLRIDKTDKQIVIHDGLDVSITDGAITIKPVIFMGGGMLVTGHQGLTAQQAGNQQAATQQSKINQQ